MYKIKNPRLKREFCGLTFENPVGFAAGFDKNAECYNEFASFGFSFMEIGTVTPKPQSGNPKPRLFRLIKDKALINRMGFNNKGVDYAVKQLTKKHKLIIGGNIGKNTLTPNENAVADYEYCFIKLYDVVDYFVVNVSCPNIKDLKKLQDKDEILKILKRLTEIRKAKNISKAILLKIAPDLNESQLDEIIEVVNLSGIDGLVASNTSTFRDGLTLSSEEIDKLGNGGLSGKPLTQKSTQIIKYIHTKSNGKIPIMAVGGIMTPEDAIEKLKAGAKLVQIYTGFIYNGPGFVKKINKQILSQL